MTERLLTAERLFRAQHRDLLRLARGVGLRVTSELREPPGSGPLCSCRALGCRTRLVVAVLRETEPGTARAWGRSAA